MSLEERARELSDKWCEYANHLISVGNDMTALQMRTTLLSETASFAAPYEAALRELVEAVERHNSNPVLGAVCYPVGQQALASASDLLEGDSGGFTPHEVSSHGKDVFGHRQDVVAGINLLHDYTFGEPVTALRRLIDPEPYAGGKDDEA